VDINNVATSTNSTGATVTFDLSPSSASYTFGFGTSQGSYPYTGVTRDQSGSVTVTIDLLDPSSVYYFQITGSESCYTSGSWSGTFATSSDTQDWLSGVVLDSNGPAVDQHVFAECYPTGGSPSANMVWDANAWTGSSGTFHIGGNYSDPGNLQTCMEDKYPITVEVLNSIPGFWNETYVIYAPPTWLSFDLPSNFVSPYIVQALDFSNANSADGMEGYSTISYTTGTTYTTTESFCWELLWSGGCTSTSTELSSSLTFVSENGDLEVSQQYWTSGTVTFLSNTRTSAVTSMDFYAPYGNPQFPGQQAEPDWLEPGTNQSGVYLLQNWGGAGSGVLVSPSYSRGGSTTVSTTQSVEGASGVDVSVGVDIYGVGVGTSVASLKWSQTSSTTETNTLSWMLSVPKGDPPVCFVVYGAGGSASSDTADLIGIWAYDPTLSDGNDTCPLP